MGSATEVSISFRRACLKSEKPLNDLGDLCIFDGELAVERLSGRTDTRAPSSDPGHFKLAMNFIAEMPGKKQ